MAYKKLCLNRSRVPDGHTFSSDEFQKWQKGCPASLRFRKVAPKVIPSKIFIQVFFRTQSESFAKYRPELPF